MRKLTIILAFGGTILVCARVVLMAVTAPITVIRVGYLPATHDSLLFIAQELALFDKRKIDIQMKPYDNSVQILNDLKSGILDVGIPGMATPAAEIGGKAPLSIIGGAAAKSAALVVKSDQQAAFSHAQTADAKIKLLLHKRVGAVRGSTGLAIFREALFRAGIPDKALDLRDFSKPSEIINALVAGDLDAGLLWSPHMTLAKERGLEIAVWMSEVLPNHVCCRQIATDAFLANRDAAAEYLAGILRADKVLREAHRKPETKARVMLAIRKYLTTLNDRQIEAELFAPNAYTTVTPDINVNGIRQYLAAMQTAELMRPDQCANVEKKVKTEYLELAYKKLGCRADMAALCVNKSAADCECTR